MSTIPLAKGYNASKLKFPVYLSQKLDGVPVRIDIDADGNHSIRSRQNKPVASVHKLVQEFSDEFLGNAALGYYDIPCTLIGEVHQTADRFAAFKDTSGIVRRQEDQGKLLAITIFEMFTPKLQEAGFQKRYEAMLELSDLHPRVHVMFQNPVYSEKELLMHFDAFMQVFPKAEGMVARSHNDQFLPGKRSWGYQKLLKEPTIDLAIIGMEEAVSQTGEPLGMAGRLIARYKGTTIGIGPGHLTHKERANLWNSKYAFLRTEQDGRRWKELIPNMIAQIKCKADDSYDALRQPTFQF